MERWESLSLRAEEAQKINAIHREMAAMKLEFCAAQERIMSYRVVLEEPHVIEDRINRITVSKLISGVTKPHSEISDHLFLKTMSNPSQRILYSLKN